MGLWCLQRLLEIPLHERYGPPITPSLSFFAIPSSPISQSVALSPKRMRFLNVGDPNLKAVLLASGNAAFPCLSACDDLIELTFQLWVTRIHDHSHVSLIKKKKKMSRYSLIMTCCSMVINIGSIWSWDHIIGLPIRSRWSCERAIDRCSSYGSSIRALAPRGRGPGIRNGYIFLRLSSLLLIRTLRF